MFNDEYTAQCDAVLDVLAAAGVRLVAPNPEQAPPPEVWVPLRPAMHVLRVPDADQRRFEQRLTRPHTDPDHLRGHFLVLADGHTVLFLELHHMQDLLHRGRHRVCIKFTTWYCRVVAALMRHGTYDPEHNQSHTRAKRSTPLSAGRNSRACLPCASPT